MDGITKDWFAFWAGIVPDQIAVTTHCDGQAYSYGTIDTNATELAQKLHHQLGINKGDRIAVLANNCIEYIYLFAAAQKLGFILVPLNYRLTGYELEQLITDADPALLLCSDDYSVASTHCPVMSLSEVMHRSLSEDKPLPTAILNENDPVFILYTSGSTGLPKGVMYTHKMLYWNSLNTSISLGVNSATTALVCMPPFHTGGWNVLLTPVLHHGGHVVIADRFDAEETLTALATYRFNQFMAVPTMLKMMSEANGFSNLRIPDLPYIIVGGEAMPLPLIEQYEHKKIAIRQGFGMTEVGPNLTSLHHTQSTKKIGSIGKPNMYVQVKLVDENGTSVKQGQLGELCFAGPVVMPGYWQNRDATDQAIRDGWLYSGDIAMMDENGYLYIKDRKKNMYISGAENVYPAEIERVLVSHPNISAAAVVGVPDAKWGEVGKAFIVVNESTTEDQLKTYCQSKLSKYKLPKHYRFLNELPTNATGKVDRAQLKELK